MRSIKLYTIRWANHDEFSLAEPDVFVSEWGEVFIDGCSFEEAKETIVNNYRSKAEYLDNLTEYAFLSHFNMLGGKDEG